MMYILSHRQNNLPKHCDTYLRRCMLLWLTRKKTNRQHWKTKLYEYILYIIHTCIFRPDDNDLRIYTRWNGMKQLIPCEKMIVASINNEKLFLIRNQSCELIQSELWSLTLKGKTGATFFRVLPIALANCPLTLLISRLSHCRNICGLLV